MYEPGPGAQIHDLNPGIKPDGLFWTIAVSEDSIEVNFGKSRASLEARHVPIEDYGTIANALFGGGPAPTLGFVSFTVTWHGVNERVNIRNDDDGFAGEFIRNTAQMAWTATVGDFTFRSDPLTTSSSSFAEIGHERNGIFFP